MRGWGGLEKKRKDLFYIVERVDVVDGGVHASLLDTLVSITHMGMGRVMSGWHECWCIPRQGISSLEDAPEHWRSFLLRQSWDM